MFDPILEPAYRLISSLADHTGAAVAIVLFTLAVRVLLLPLSLRQARAHRDRLRIAPKIARLRERHRANPDRLNRELAALYAKEGTSPLAGCLPGLAQLPFFSVTYQLFISATIAGQPNALLAQSALGVPLGEHFAAVVATSGLFSPAALVFAGLLFALAVLAWVLSRRMGEVPIRALRLLPFGVILAAGVFPLATGIYLLVSTAWSTAERIVLYPRSAALA
ncbi:membrane protein insertase YidC [Thermopolyspora sp. NPDC052614]|uniref:YidC/Oxa1 family membrane protein insertase n=1 Tax=Thermopolyspora sp. NPDC052614 TaxID=3155682 RepID=UPI00342A0D48